MHGRNGFPCAVVTKQNTRMEGHKQGKKACLAKY